MFGYTKRGGAHRHSNEIISDSRKKRGPPGGIIVVMAADKSDDTIVAVQKEANGMTPPRENLILTAVAFLQNPRVQGSPVSQKRIFLAKKGLTAEEIDLALERSMPQKHNGIVQPYAYAKPGQSVSLWMRWKEMCTSVMVIGATCYSCYYLYRRYVEPLIIGRPKEDEDRTSKIERHMQELNKSLSQLRHSLLSIESTLSQRSSERASEVQSTVHDALAIAEMKSDIVTIKSLLLSRRQFPSTPAGIPTWQMKDAVLEPTPPHEEDKVTTECLNGQQEA